MKIKHILVGMGVIALTAVGVQLVAVQVASAHTPSATIGCTAWPFGAQSSRAAQNNTYSYAIDGASAVTGSFEAQFAQSGTFAVGSGNHTLVGHVYQNNDPNAQYSTTYNLSTHGCATYIAIPAAPVATPPTRDAAGAATIPPATATRGLASTRVPTKDILLLGGLFVLGGVAMCIGFFNRRWFRR